MKIVVIGGSGLIGSQLVNRLRQLNHDAIAASPATGVNTITGEGLNAVMKNADVVVDVSNSPSFADDDVLEFFRKSTWNLLTAESYAGVKHHIALSVVGTERHQEIGYFRGKLAQEELIRDSGIPYSILHSTQFFEFAKSIAQGGTVGEEVHMSTGAIQPIASSEVVAALTDIALGQPLNAIIEIAGPERMPMYEFIGIYLDRTDDPRTLVPDEHARYFGAEIDDETLVPLENPRLGKIKYQDWLSAQPVTA
jgi:uncharacterized protein YbjT (DUF2867 family)